MQYDNKEYDAGKHDRYKALVVKQPYAQLIGAGRKTIDVRGQNTSYRGDVLICSSKSPVIDGMQSSATIAIVELYDTKPIADLTPEDWAKTMIPDEERATLTKGFGWLMRNARRVVEMPSSGQLGIFNFVCDKGDIVEYPRAVVIDRKGWKAIQRQITDK